MNRLKEKLKINCNEFEQMEQKESIMKKYAISSQGWIKLSMKTQTIGRWEGDSLGLLSLKCHSVELLKCWNTILHEVIEDIAEDTSCKKTKMYRWWTFN